MIYDVTRRMGEATPVWPGDAPFRLRWSMRRAAGAAANVSEVSHSVHFGTHVDAPYHVSEQGARVGELPLDAFLGDAVVLDVRGKERIEVEDVEGPLAGGGVERVLFRTGCWTRDDRFPESFPALAPAAARRLALAGVRLVGTDAPSVDPLDSEDLPAHHALAVARIPILENLLLDQVEAGTYELIALPLRLVDADASPVRAVLLRR